MIACECTWWVSGRKRKKLLTGVTSGGYMLQGAGVFLTSGSQEAESGSRKINLLREGSQEEPVRV